MQNVIGYLFRCIKAVIIVLKHTVKAQIYINILLYKNALNGWREIYPQSSCLDQFFLTLRFALVCFFTSLTYAAFSVLGH